MYVWVYAFMHLFLEMNVVSFLPIKSACLCGIFFTGTITCGEYVEEECVYTV